MPKDKKGRTFHVGDRVRYLQRDWTVATIHAQGVVSLEGLTRNGRWPTIRLASADEVESMEPRTALELAEVPGDGPRAAGPDG